MNRLWYGVGISKLPSAGGVTAALMAMLLSTSCSKDAPNEGKRLPRLMPSTAVPDGLPRVDVSVDGVLQTALTTESLQAIKPDWADDRRRVWRFSTLFDGKVPSGSVISITGVKGLSVDFKTAVGTATEMVPVLMSSQRGALMALFVDPANPFPSFHGEGGRLGRSPDPTPRIADVTRIEIRTPN
jgi:hypothetical protein